MKFNKMKHQKLQTVLFFIILLIFCACENPSAFFKFDDDLSLFLSKDVIEVYESDTSTAKYYEITPLKSILFDDFDHAQTSSWQATENEKLNIRIENGNLLYTAKNGSWSMWKSFDLESYKDFQIEIRLKSNSTETDKLSGVLFNIDAENTRPCYYFSMLNRARIYSDIFIGYEYNGSKDLHKVAVDADKQDFHLYTIRKTGDNILFFLNRQYKYTAKMELLHNYGLLAGAGETLTVDYVKIDDMTQGMPEPEKPVDFSITLDSKTYKSLKITANRSNANGNVINEQGFIYSAINSNPDWIDDRMDGGTTGTKWTKTLTMLLPGTKYYVRAYALCNGKTYVSYSDVYEFTTDALPNQSGLQITKLEFANSDGGNVINDYGNTLYSNTMRYLLLRINYNSLSIAPQNVTLYVKIVKPDGTLVRVANAPEGYSISRSFTTEGNYSENTQQKLDGLGSGTQSNFPAGTYNVEIWSSAGEQLFQKNLVIR
ncbi:hypothetical protein FACS189413_06780 [Bacteroidia bacterium]|nr:hypothetical protein FACS189413_06780 [Bacteroidia bacterium]